MILNKILQDKFLRHNFVFFVGSMLVAFFNYLYHPVLGRMMLIESFGEVQVLISLFLLLSMVIGVFRLIVINIMANNQDPEDQQETILMLQKIGLYVVLSFSFLIIIFSPYLKTFYE